MADPEKKALTAKDWLKRVDARKRVFDNKWYKEARQTLKVYEADSGGDENSNRVPFNILFSNTETLLPALYNSTPRPDVARRFTSGKEDVVHHAAAEVGEKFLTYFADTNGGGEYETFDNSTRTAVLSGLLAGMGQCRIQAHTDGQGNTQEICIQQVAFDRFIWGFARTWADVPWVAYGHDFLRDDFEATFPDCLNQQWYQQYKWDDSDTIKEPDNTDPAKKLPTLLVWEVWNWGDKTIYFVCDNCGEDFLQKDPYPFDLTTKFPSPEPFKPIKRLLDISPIPPYRLYRAKAEQLNMISKRIDGIVKAIKVRGIYNANIGEFQQLFEEDLENVMLPSQNAAGFAAEGLDKQIWLVPVEKLVTTLQELYRDEQDCKNVIYEIMGIADIMRGSSQASETLGAQQIKNQWGTLRLKRVQLDVQIFCRDLFRIALQFGVELLPPATIQEMSGAVYMLEAVKQQAQAAIAMLQQTQQQASPDMGQNVGAVPGPATPPQPGSAGMPPPGGSAPGGDPGMPSGAPIGGPPTPPVPAGLLAQLQLPSIEDALAVLKGNFTRQYAIDIETNSTLDLEATEDKQNIIDFMNAFGQMLAGLTPLVSEGMMTFDVAKIIMIEVTRKFKMGRDIEDELRSMTAPQQQGQSQGLQMKIDGLTQQASIAQETSAAQLAAAKAEGSTRVEQATRQLVQVTGQLQVALVKLAEGNLEQAKTALGEATAMAKVKLAGEQVDTFAAHSNLTAAAADATSANALQLERLKGAKKDVVHAATLGAQKLQAAKATPKVQ